MVARQRTDDATRTVVYQYGAVPIGAFPAEGVDELWRANRLWNQLVELHNKNRQSYESARRAASDAYALISESIALKQAEIDQAFKDKRIARMQAGTTDADHPLIVAANAVIETLMAERKTLFDKAKPLRKQADEGLDKKALADQFREAVKHNRRVEQSGIASVLADQVVAYFQTAREKAFKDAATLRFHRFDGSGYFFIASIDLVPRLMVSLSPSFSAPARTPKTHLCSSVGTMCVLRNRACVCVSRWPAVRPNQASVTQSLI